MTQNLEIVTTLTIVLASLYLVIFVFSLIFVSKLMAVQLILVPQVTFAGLIMISQSETLLSPLKILFMTNGFNPLFTTSQIIPPNLSSLFFSSDFLSNFNICLILMLLPIPLGLILLLVGLVKQNQSYKMYSLKLLKEWFFTALLFFQFHWTISLGINAVFGSLISMDGIVGIGVLFIFVVYLVLLYISPESFGDYKNYFKQDGTSSNFYIIICCFRIILAFVIIFLWFMDFCGLVALGIIFLFGCLLFKFLPYQNNTRPFFNICIIFIVLGLIYIFKTTYTTQQTTFTDHILKIILILNLIALAVNTAYVVGKIYPKDNQLAQNQQQEQEVADKSINDEIKQVKGQIKEQKKENNKLSGQNKTSKTKNVKKIQPNLNNSQQIEITNQDFIWNGIGQEDKKFGQLGNTIETLNKSSNGQKKTKKLNSYSFQTEVKKQIIQKYQIYGYEVEDQVIQAPKKNAKNVLRQTKIIYVKDNPKQLSIYKQSNINKKSNLMSSNQSQIIFNEQDE